jgi:hypothetical protein
MTDYIRGKASDGSRGQKPGLHFDAGIRLTSAMLAQTQFPTLLHQTTPPCNSCTSPLMVLHQTITMPVVCSHNCMYTQNSINLTQHPYPFPSNIEGRGLLVIKKSTKSSRCLVGQIETLPTRSLSKCHLYRYPAGASASLLSSHFPLFHFHSSSSSSSLFPFSCLRMVGGRLIAHCD